MEGLGINLPGLITQIISFLVLFGVLYALLYKPVLRIMDQRSQKIREGLESAERARQEAVRSQEEMQKKMDEARAEGQALVAEAREIAERFKEEELTKARQEIAGERDRARANIQREMNVAIEELRQEFAGLAVSAAERVIERSLDKEAHRDLIEKALQESSDLKRK